MSKLFDQVITAVFLTMVIMFIISMVVIAVYELTLNLQDIIILTLAWLNFGCILIVLRLQDIQLLNWMTKKFF